ncbi:MAG: hypothetical protein ACAH80_00560 [Alphaproteobacteria bacterium]
MANEHDPIRDLEDARRKTTDRWLAFKGASRREGTQAGVWAVIGGAAVAADFALLGGLGTAIALMSGATWLSYKKEAKRLEKELVNIEKSITQLREEREERERNQPQLKNGLNEEFSPAAKRQIDALKSRLEEVEKMMDKMQAGKEQDNDEIDKPKMKKPGGPKL